MDNIGVIFLTWKRLLQQKLIPHQITLKQLFVLGQLEKNEFLYPAQVARMLFCDRPTASVIIRNMDKKGWLAREKYPADGKRIRVRLTKSGHRKLNSIPVTVFSLENMDFDPLGCLTDHELRLLCELTAKVSNHLEQIRG